MSGKIDIEKVLEIDYILQLHSKYVKKNAIKTFVSAFKILGEHVNKVTLKQESSSKFLFLRTLHRPSYNKLWESVMEQCPTPYIEIQYDWDNTHLINDSLVIVRYTKLVRILKTIYLVISQCTYFFKVRKNEGLAVQISTFFGYLVLLAESKKIEKLPFEILVVFADMQRLDNLVVQRLNNKKKTVTLQHGLYINYDKAPNVNSVNYKNVVANYFLAWGEETKNLILTKNRNCEIVICGNPTIEGSLDLKRENSFFTVVMDQPMFHLNNQQLLDIAFSFAAQYNLKINIRLHPIDKLGNYRVNEDLIVVEDFKKSSFAIGHTSTFIYELMAMGIPTYKMKSEVPCNVMDHKLIFENEQELFLIQQQELDLEELTKFYFAFIGEESKTKYRDFFKSLININVN